MSDRIPPISTRTTPQQREYIVNQAKKSNMSLSQYMLNSALNSSIKIVDKSADIAMHLCRISSEVNLLKLRNPTIDFDNLDEECVSIWLLLNPQKEII